MRSGLLILPILFFLNTASAWIIPARTIVQKTVENHGSSPYQIEQDVIFEHGDSKIVLKETWQVLDDSSMKVTVQSRDPKNPISLQFIYNEGQRMQLQPSGKTGKAIEPEFAERPFHFRTSEAMAYFLKQNKVAPDGILLAKALPAKTSDIKHETESFVRYGRSGGVINYVFGSPTPSDTENLNPGVWIEQDAFVIRKIRFHAGATIEASDYASFPKGLWFPKTRTISWGEHKVTVKVTSLDIKKNLTAAAFKSSTLEITNDFAALSKDENTTIISEFYTRFR